MLNPEYIRAANSQSHFNAGDSINGGEVVANQFRVLLSALAYTLMRTIRQRALAGTELARARRDIIRLKLLKIGASVVRNTRQITMMLSESCPYKTLFRLAASRLQAG